MATEQASTSSNIIKEQHTFKEGNLYPLVPMQTVSEQETGIDPSKAWYVHAVCSPNDPSSTACSNASLHLLHHLHSEAQEYIEVATDEEADNASNDSESDDASGDIKAYGASDDDDDDNDASENNPVNILQEAELWTGHVIAGLKDYRSEGESCSIYVVSAKGWDAVQEHLSQIRDENLTLPVTRMLQIQETERYRPVKMTTHNTSEKTDYYGKRVSVDSKDLFTWEHRLNEIFLDMLHIQTNMPNDNDKAKPEPPDVEMMDVNDVMDP